MADLDRLGRRTFAGLVAAGSIFPWTIGVAGEQAAEVPLPESKVTTEEESLAAEVERAVESIRREYSPELDPHQWDKVRQQIGYHLARSKVLSSAGLRNADSPAIYFRAWRADLGHSPPT